MLTAQLPAGHALKEDPPVAAMQRLQEHATAIQKQQPTLLYNEAQVEAVAALANELGVPLPDSATEPFGNTPGMWPAFPDTVPALQRLAAHYKLVILSNVDNRNMASTLERQLAPASFAAVYTAQDVGSYKPDHKNFHYLFEKARKDLGIDHEKGHLLHVARGIAVDHVPAKELGLPSVWIMRGVDNGDDNGIRGNERQYKDQVSYEWSFGSLEQFADEVERQFAAKGT